MAIKLNPQTKQDRAELLALERRLAAVKRDFARASLALTRQRTAAARADQSARRKLDAEWKKSERRFSVAYRTLNKGVDRAVNETVERIAIITGRLGK